MRRVLPVLLLLCGLRAGVSADPTPSADAAWKQLAARGPALVATVRAELLAGKNLGKASLVLRAHRYQAQLDGPNSYGQAMSRFYFERVLKAKTIAETFQVVRDLAKCAAGFREKNRPLLAEAEELRGLAADLREAVEKDPAVAKTLKHTTFAGAGTDELSTSLKKLSDAVAAGDGAASVRWAAEVEGAAARLADLLRWVDLQTEWAVDLASVLDGFAFCVETSDASVAAAGGWKNFMFGRLPGCSSLIELTVSDALACEQMLCDFFTVSETEAARLGAEDDRGCAAVTPLAREAFGRIRDSLPGRENKAFAAIPLTDYELSMLNWNLLRYVGEKEVDHLAASLQAYAKREKKPEIAGMMEVLHIAQGAYGSTTAAGDRYHEEMIAWASKISGEPETALKQAHALANGFYTRGGRANYRGRLWTIHDAMKAKATDCIRASQMMGSALANAGYPGIHPVRICRGNVKQKIAGTSGHTFLCALVGRKNVCLDPLVGRTFLQPFEKIHEKDATVISVAMGYRSLDSYITGRIRFPQGPVRPVQLRVPYYGLKREGLDGLK